jgi:hypothetical protein
MRIGVAAFAALIAGMLGGRADAMIVWGDVHAHSRLSDDGAGDPRDFFRAARDGYYLDFVVLSDHDIYLTADEWNTLNAAAKEFDEPGRFVAFAGVEWTHAWHMNFYFKQGGGQICGGGGGPPCDGSVDARRFYGSRVLSDEGASHFNHPNPLTPVNWGRDGNELATNVEVWNTLWNFQFGPEANDEWFGGPLWALKVGFRLGFVGVSDDQFFGTGLFQLLGTGLTACHVNALTRSEVIDALRNRRCYASNGPRPRLDFDVDGTPMGGALSAPIGSTVTANVSVVAETAPTAIEFVVNGQVAARKVDCTDNSCSFSLPIRVRGEYNFVYAKVYGTEAQRVWSSAVWVHGSCASPGDCPSARIVPGMGSPSNRCLMALRVLPQTSLSPGGSPQRRAVCANRDPRCDFDLGPTSCTFNVSVCAGVDRDADPSCTFSPIDSVSLSILGADENSFVDTRNEQTLLAAAQAVRTAQSPGTCGPYVPITVVLRETPNGPRRGAQTFFLRSTSGDRVDRARLSLVCTPERNRFRSRAPASSRSVFDLPAAIP